MRDCSRGGALTPEQVLTVAVGVVPDLANLERAASSAIRPGLAIGSEFCLATQVRRRRRRCGRESLADRDSCRPASARALSLS